MGRRIDLDVAAVLLDTYLFEVGPAASLEPLVRQARAWSYGRGEHVFSIGDPAICLHVVAEGRLKESMPTADGARWSSRSWRRAGPSESRACSRAGRPHRRPRGPGAVGRDR